MRDLEREGVVAKVRGKGTFVVPAARRERTIEVAIPDAMDDRDASSFLMDVEAAARKIGYSVKRIRKGL